MKIETPRTDAAEKLAQDSYEMSRECGDPSYPGADLAEFARELERELSDWRTCAGRLREFAIAYSSHPRRNPGDKLMEALDEYDRLTTH